MAAAVAAADIVIALPSTPIADRKRPDDKKPHDNKTPTKKHKKDAAAAADPHQSLTSKKQEKNNKSNNNSTKEMKEEKEEAKANDLPLDLEASASCSFPMARVWRFIRGEAATADARTTNDAVFLINKASEFFLQRLTGDAFATAVGERRKSISYKYLSSAVCNGKQYEFLSDFVPEKVKAEDALKAWEAAQSLADS